jgi:hypothetical protein
MGLYIAAWRNIIMAREMSVVHVTHEAVGKIGGIGAVLHGFFTCNSYLHAVHRSILVSPLFTTQGSVLDRLGRNGEVLYSSPDGLANTEYAPAFRKIQNFYNAPIVYGRKTFIDPLTRIKSSPEVLLIDVRNMNSNPINAFKRRLFEEFRIRSHLFEHLWEYEQYVRLAPVAIAALKAIGAANGSTTIISHEFMGMPTALAAILDHTSDFKTAFYAHEVATVRRIVETHPGRDTMFYNVIRRADQNGLYVNDLFGDQSSFFKHALVRASKHCHAIYAVGDYVLKELRFLAPEFKTADIDVVYNGVPVHQIGIAEKLDAKEKLRLYCQNLLGYKPDFVFTHVTRLIPSKGLWRDLYVLRQIEADFAGRDKTAVLFLLSTEVSQRPRRDIFSMESAYNWPVAHREGWPDLSGGEADFYTAVQQFNARSRNVKIVFINQFGFCRDHCGARMPENIEFMDIRKGSDVELGLSVYEPFGISQLEPLTFGGICVVSNVCGCAGFVRDVAGAAATGNIIIADYTTIDDAGFPDIDDVLRIDRTLRDRIEQAESKRLAKQIIASLPKTESEIGNMIQTGYALARNMSWNVVVEDYLLKSLQYTRPPRTQTAHRTT